MGTLHEDHYTCIIISHSVLLWMRNFSDKICTENQNTQFMFNNFFEIMPLWDNVEKYSRTGQATDDNMVHIHCMLGTSGYKLTLRIYNTYCFPTVTMDARTYLTVTLNVHCLYCLNYRGNMTMMTITIICERWIGRYRKSYFKIQQKSVIRASTSMKNYC